MMRHIGNASNVGSSIVPDIRRLTAMEIEVERLRLEVRTLTKRLEQTESDRDEFRREIRQQWEAMKGASR